MTELERAAAQAIRRGRVAFQDLQTVLNGGLHELESVGVELARWLPQKGGPEETTPSQAQALLRRFFEQIQQRQAAIKDRVARQEKALSHVIVAPLGRTGTGKSSFVEAWSRGNGARVSSGRSDWTQQIEAVPCAGGLVHVYDLPGIEGPGWCRSRQELEAETARIVEVADLVVLFFDSTSQQEGELRKPAEWIGDFRPPTIAILNVKEEEWRHPVLLPNHADRWEVSQSVRQQMAHIQEELAKLGLRDVPVVAIHCQRAMFARLQEPYAGPELLESVFRRQRSTYGEQRLEVWSNFPALEEFLTTLLTEYALDLRVGMLKKQVKGHLGQTKEELGQTSAACLKLAQKLELSIVATLRVLGVLGTEECRVLRDDRIQGDLLSTLERLRGKPFVAPEVGDLEAGLDRRLKARLGSAQRNALNRAEAAILRAFSERRLLTKDALEQEIFPDRQALGKLVSALVQEIGLELARRLKLPGPALPTELSRWALNLSDIDGNAGAEERTHSQVVRFGGLTLRACAIATSDPASVVAGNLGASALREVGQGLDNKAEAKWLQLRSEAIAQARRQIRRAFERVENAVRSQVQALRQDWILRALRGPLEQAVLCRELLSAANHAVAKLATLADELPAWKSAPKRIARVQKILESRLYSGDSDAAGKLWRGEGWPDDRDGLASAEATVEPPTVRPFPPALPPTILNALRQRFAAATSALVPGLARAWCQQATQTLAVDVTARPLLAALQAVGQDGRLRIGLAGDYNTGKSALIKRWCLSHGAPVPSGLVVAAVPSTQHAAEYPIGDVVFIDTPGLQSGRPEQEARALEALGPASVVLFLVTPTLLTGETKALETLLRGDVARGLLPKGSRILFVITRLDTVAPNAEQDEKGYARFCESKRGELGQLLHHLGIDVGPESILCVAIDPHGFVGNRPDASPHDYARTGHWDGFAALEAAVTAAGEGLSHGGSELLLLETGLPELVRLETATGEALRRVQGLSEILQQTQTQCSEAQAVAEMLAQDIAEDVANILDRHISPLIESIRAAKTPEELLALRPPMEECWADKALVEKLEECGDRWHKDITRWHRYTRSQLDGQLPARTFGIYFPDLHASIDLPELKRGPDTWKILEYLAYGAPLLRTATPEYALWAGHAVGHKFAPGGAQKAARQARWTGVGLGLVGAAVDIRSLTNAEEMERQREAARAQLVDALQTSRDDVLRQLTDEAPDAAGPLAELLGCRQELADLAAGLDRRVHALGEERTQCQGTLARYAPLVASARTLLQLPALSPEESL